MLVASTGYAQAGAMADMKHDQMGTMAKFAQNLGDDGLAIKGYDAVAYFNAAPAKGSAAFSAKHNGATYHFASAANRDAFLASPDKYVPAYGGYCAMGVAGNAKFDIDPLAYKVENGKLYLNKDKKTQTVWLKDVPGNIVKADKNWPVLGAVK